MPGLTRGIIDGGIIPLELVTRGWVVALGVLWVLLVVWAGAGLRRW